MFKNIVLDASDPSAHGAVAAAHSGATGVEMDRMKGMSAMKKTMAGLAPMMQGSARYDGTAVQKTAAAHDVSCPFNMRRRLKPWRAAYVKPATISRVLGQSAGWNSGQQLVTGATHCAACHTGRNMLAGLQENAALAGNDNLPAGSVAPTIPAADLVARGWAVPNRAYALRTGVMPDGDVLGGSMAEGVQYGTAYMNDADLEAIATYLLTRGGALPRQNAPETPVANAWMSGMVHTSGMVME